MQFLRWGSLRRRAREGRTFFSRTIWQTRLDSLSSHKALWYATARILARTFQQLILSDALHLRAAALTYFTMLSLVPLLAFAFALLKGFGAYDALIADTIRPQLLQLFSGDAALQSAVKHILHFVTQTGVASLGFVGLFTLLYAATRLLRNIEGALNDIWGAQSGRGPLRQLTDYLSIIVVTPICMMLAAGLTTLGQVEAIIRFLEDRLGLGSVVEWLLRTLAPLGVVFAGLVFLYAVMPHTSVRARSAVLGAAIGSLLWYLALIAHVRFQVGVARYNALYSGFGAFPIFLVWVQVSWLVVLVGAQVAASHQHNRRHAQHSRIQATGRAAEETAWLAALLEIAQAFASAAPPPGLSALSESVGALEPLLERGLRCLVAAGILVPTADSDQPAFVLAWAPERIRLKQVLDAWRDIRPPSHALSGASDALRCATTFWAALDRAIETSAENRSLRDLLCAPKQRPVGENRDSSQ